MTMVFNRLGPYDIVEPIGSGGMAHVYLATDSRSGQRVALRLVPIGRSHDACEILDAERWGARLQTEFSAVCPLVPRVFDHGELTGYLFVAMEYLDGENLSDLIARGPLPAARAVEIAIELCRFLEAAHTFETVVDERPLRSLLHGDLKPRNVRLTSAGLKVLDFGVAKALSLSRKVTRTDFGTIAYMSPERLETGEMDGRADLWAIAVMLHEMLGGVRPFTAPDTRRLERLITSRRPAPVLNGACPAALQAVISRMLAPDIDQRYATPADIREDLARYQAGVETTAEREGWPARSDEPETRRTAVSTAPADDRTRRTRPESTPGVAAAAAVPPSAAAAPSAPAPTARPRLARWKRRVRTALVVIALLLVVNEISVGSDAGRAEGIAAAGELGSIGELWAQYDRLERRSHLGIGVVGLRRALTARTEALAEQVIDNYRSQLPTVREAQWRAARDALRRAVSAAPGRTRLRAALRYCEGHLHRIDGEARKSRRQAFAARQEFTEAVAAFREAAELRSGWPDPFLGLMRTFIYGLEDIDRGADALQQAQRLGYTSGERETTQLADGYRARGDQSLRIARQLLDLPQEPEHLERAAAAYRHAVALYGQVPSYGDVASTLRRTHRALTQVEERLAEIAAARDQGSVGAAALQSEPSLAAAR